MTFSKSEVQKNLIKQLLRNKDVVKDTPQKYINMLRSYLISDLSPGELSKKYKISPAAFEEACKATSETLINRVKRISDETIKREKLIKAIAEYKNKRISISTDPLYLLTH